MPARAMSGGADGAADALIRRYARRGSGGASPAGSYRVLITGIDSADDYIRLMSAPAGDLGGAQGCARSGPGPTACCWSWN